MWNFIGISHRPTIMEFSKKQELFLICNLHGSFFHNIEYKARALLKWFYKDTAINAPFLLH